MVTNSLEKRKTVQEGRAWLEGKGAAIIFNLAAQEDFIEKKMLEQKPVRDKPCQPGEERPRQSEGRPRPLELEQ